MVFHLYLLRLCCPVSTIVPIAQNTKEYFSNRLKIEYGIPQGSISGPLLFNINSTDIFCECEDSVIEKYANDTNPYVCASDVDTIISESQITASKLFTWFNNNHIKANPEESNLFFQFQNSEKSLFWWSLGRIKFN